MATRVETPPAPRRMTIGAVCDMLRPEFTDLSISKIRYLEDQGLIEPHRTRGGYRLFSGVGRRAPAPHPDAAARRLPAAAA